MLVPPKKNTSTEFDQTSGYCGLAMLTPKINHHKWGGVFLKKSQNIQWDYEK